MCSGATSDDWAKKGRKHLIHEEGGVYLDPVLSRAEATEVLYRLRTGILEELHLDSPSRPATDRYVEEDYRIASSNCLTKR